MMCHWFVLIVSLTFADTITNYTLQLGMTTDFRTLSS